MVFCQFDLVLTCRMLYQDDVGYPANGHARTTHHLLLSLDTQSRALRMRYEEEGNLTVQGNAAEEMVGGKVMGQDT